MLILRTEIKPTATEYYLDYQPDDDPFYIGKMIRVPKAIKDPIQILQAINKMVVSIAEEASNHYKICQKTKQLSGYRKSSP